MATIISNCQDPGSSPLPSQSYTSSTRRSRPSTPRTCSFPGSSPPRENRAFGGTCGMLHLETSSPSNFDAFESQNQIPIDPWTLWADEFSKSAKLQSVRPYGLPVKLVDDNITCFNSSGFGDAQPNSIDYTMSIMVEGSNTTKSQGNMDSSWIGLDQYDFQPNHFVEDSINQGYVLETQPIDESMRYFDMMSASNQFWPSNATSGWNVTTTFTQDPFQAIDATPQSYEITPTMSSIEGQQGSLNMMAINPPAISVVSTSTYIDSFSSPTVTVPPIETSLKVPFKSQKGSNSSAQKTWRVQESKEQYSNGTVVGLKEVWTLDNRVRKRRDETERRKIAVNRILGACPEHQKSKKGCDPSCIPYLRCLTTKLPNFRHELGEVQFFRKRPAEGHPLETNRTELFLLQDIELRNMSPQNFIRLTQGIGPDLEVYVTTYQPLPGDKTHHRWFSNGQAKQINMPPYCVASLDQARRALFNYIQRSINPYLERIIGTSSSVGQAILLLAIEFAKQTKSSLVTGALQILAVNRMIELDWQISGPETLGIAVVDEPDCTWHGKVPITPMMDTQLDQIIIQDFLIPLRNVLLSELQDKIKKQPNDYWFEVFLTVFILTTNTELLLRHSRLNALRYNAQSRYNSIPLAESYIKGHNILLSHFHYYFRRSPVIMEKNRPESSAQLSKQVARDFRAVLTDIRSQKDQVFLLRQQKKYEADLFWSHQLFFPNWKPEQTKVVEDH